MGLVDRIRAQCESRAEFVKGEYADMERSQSSGPKENVGYRREPVQRSYR